MRSKVIRAVEYFYKCVMMSIKFWWLIIRNFVICGMAAGIHGAMAYFASPKEEKDLHQKINSDVHFNLTNSQFLSAAAMPGLVMAVISSMYKKLEKQQLLPN